MTNWTKLYEDGVDIDEEFDSFEPMISGSRLDTEEEKQYIGSRDQENTNEENE